MENFGERFARVMQERVTIEEYNPVWPELFDAARTTLIHRGDVSTGWSMGWKVNLWARLQDGDRAHRVLGYLLKLTGWNAEDLIGSNCFDILIPPDIRADMKQMYAELSLEHQVLKEIVEKK